MNNQEFKDLGKRIFAKAFILFLPLYFMFVLVGSIFLDGLLRSKYSHLSILIIALSPAFLFRAFANLAGELLRGVDRPIDAAKIQFSSLIFYIAGLVGAGLFLSGTSFSIVVSLGYFVLAVVYFKQIIR